MKGLLHFTWLPAVVVGGATYGVLTGDTFWRTLCCGILAALAFVAWASLNILVASNAPPWEHLAHEAVKDKIVDTVLLERMTNIAVESTRELHEHDPERAQRYMDDIVYAGAVHAEHREED